MHFDLKQISVHYLVKLVEILSINNVSKPSRTDLYQTQIMQKLNFKEHVLPLGVAVRAKWFGKAKFDAGYLLGNHSVMIKVICQ